MNNGHTIGSIDVLNQRGKLKPLDSKLYQPTYSMLSTYDHLIAKGSGSKVLEVEGDLDRTIELIRSTIQNYRWQVRDLAKHLYDRDPKQAAYNVWHFIEQNIQYQLDTPGVEEIRTPAATWADRSHGVDCEDYAIFGASLLLNMGHKPVNLMVVAFSGSPAYQHIFYNLSGIVVDNVLDQFNTEPGNISKRMTIQVLNGTSGLSGAQNTEKILREISELKPGELYQVRLGRGVSYFAGRSYDKTTWLFGTFLTPENLMYKNVSPDRIHTKESVLATVKSAIDFYGKGDQQDLSGIAGSDKSVTEQLIQKQAALIEQAKKSSGKDRRHLHREIRKMDWVIAADGEPAQHIILAMMPYVLDATPQGRIVLKPGADPKTIAGFAQAAQGALDMSEGWDAAKARFQDKIGPLTDQLHREMESGDVSGLAGSFADAVTSVGSTIMQYNPASIGIRAAFRTVVGWNAFNIAKTLAPIALDWNETGVMDRLNSMSAADRKEAVIKLLKAKSFLQKFWVELNGGDWFKLVESIEKGYTKVKPDVNATPPDGLGEPATLTAAIVSAAGLVAAVVKWLKDNVGIDLLKWLGNVITGGGKGDEEPSGTTVTTPGGTTTVDTGGGSATGSSVNRQAFLQQVRNNEHGLGTYLGELFKVLTSSGSPSFTQTRDAGYDAFYTSPKGLTAVSVFANALSTFSSWWKGKGGTMSEIKAAAKAGSVKPQPFTGTTTPLTTTALQVLSKTELVEMVNLFNPPKMAPSAPSGQTGNNPNSENPHMDNVYGEGNPYDGPNTAGAGKLPGWVLPAIATVGVGTLIVVNSNKKPARKRRA